MTKATIYYASDIHGSELLWRKFLNAGPFYKADVIIMGHILHDWGLDTKKMLLKKAYNALPAGGSLIVYEALIDDDRREKTQQILDLERTAASFLARTSSVRLLIIPGLNVVSAAELAGAMGPPGLSANANAITGRAKCCPTSKPRPSNCRRASMPRKRGLDTLRFSKLRMHCLQLHCAPTHTATQPFCLSG